MDTTKDINDKCDMVVPTTQPTRRTRKKGLSLQFFPPQPRPIIYDEIMAKLDGTFSPRQKTEMCFDSRAYATALELDQDYELDTMFWYHDNDTNRYYTVQLHSDRTKRTILIRKTGKNKREAEAEVYKTFVSEIKLWINTYHPIVGVSAQMDSTDSTLQGPSVLEGEKHINTIMTSAVPTERTVLPITLPQGILDKMCCAQESPSFPIWQDRKILLNSGNLSTSDAYAQLIESWTFPRDLYLLSKTPVNRPFEQFMFTKPNIEFTIKVNSQKFSLGRYVLSYYYEPGAIGTALGYNSVLSALLRDHVLLDLGESNEGIMNIAFRNKCPYTTTLRNNTTSFYGASNVKVTLHCLTPMAVADGASTTTPYTVYVSAKDTKFIGMRYAVVPSAQMGAAYSGFMDTSKSLISGIKSIPVIGGLAGGAAGALGHLSIAIGKPFAKPSVIKGIEDDLKYIGIIGNRDKPTNIREPSQFTPNVTGNLSAGTNIAENLMSMRLDPTATCVNLPDHLPELTIESLHDYIQIWGLAGFFDWNAQDVIGKNLYMTTAMPGYDPVATDTISNRYVPPVDAVAAFFTYYSGEMEYRFDFICNQFHTGIVTCAYIPYHPSFTAAEATSGYWKIFDLREQKSFTFTVPYINNTVSRLLRTSSVFAGKGENIPTPGVLKLFVTNPLNPVDTAPSRISVNVFRRAKPSMRFSYPKPVFGTQYFSGSYANQSYGTSAAVVAQMDTGDKEDIDQTPDFPNILPFSQQLQTNEDHMNIKDLMRRFTGHGRITLTANQSYTLPVVLPNVRSTGYSRYLQHFIQRQFRYYRGSIRLMFTTRTPDTWIYFTHLPQSNWSELGPVTTSADPTNSASLHFSGMASQIMISRINPIMKLEVPWHGVYDYLDCIYGVDSAAEAVGFIDKLAANLGHILITSTAACEIDYFTAIGDDGEFVKLLPLPVTASVVNQSTTATRTIDVNPSVDTVDSVVAQVDSDEEEAQDARMDPDLDDALMAQYVVPDNTVLPQQRQQGFCKSVYNRITNSMIDAMSPVKNSFDTFKRLPQMENRLLNVIEKGDATLEYIKEAANNIMTGIKTSLSWITNTGAIFSAILHFLQTVINPCWESFVIAIVGVIVSLGCFASDFAEKLMEFFLKFRPTAAARDHRTANQEVIAHCEHNNCSTCRSECDPRCRVCSEQNMFSENSLNCLVSLMFASIAGYLGWKSEGPGAGLAKGLFKFNNSFWMTIRSSGLFLKHLVTLMTRIFRWIAEKTGIGRTAITLTENNDSVREFVKEATLMLDERNLQYLETSGNIKYRFWYTVTAAHQMVQKFTGSNLPEATSILRLATKVIERGNKVAIQSMACPVRYEPFVLAVSGPTQIGKSYMLQEMLPKLLASDAYKIRTHAPPVCVRTPGVQFWNTYNNQPCILYDDFLAVLSPEVAVPQVTELYNLKSSAQFNLNMADLSEKKLLGNPFLVALSCNNPFATLNGTVCKEAFLRRKEHLWKITLRPEFKTLAEVPRDILEDFSMYQFQRYTDPANPQSLTGDKLTYAQWYEVVKTDCAAYHLREQNNVRRRLEGLKVLLPETARTMMNEVNPFNIFFAAYTGAADDHNLTQGGLLPSELVDLQLRELSAMQATPAIVENLPGMPPPTGIPAAQMDYSRIPTRMYNYLKSLVVIPVEQNPDPERYAGRGECAVCYEEKELTTGCESNHKICNDCNNAMFATRLTVNYTCPVCRADLAQLQDIQQWSRLSSRLRPLLFAQRAKAKGKQILSSVHKYWSKLVVWISSRPWAVSCLYALLVCGYIGGLTYAEAVVTNAANEQQMHIWNYWSSPGEDDYRGTRIANFGPFFRAETYTMTHDEYLRSRSVVSQMDNDIYQDAEASTSTTSMYTGRMNLGGPEWRKHPQIVRKIDGTRPTKATVEDRCPHNQFLSITKTEDVYYEVDTNGHRYWELGLFRGQRVFDNPCQFDDCLWKDVNQRYFFLNKWAYKHTYEIETRKREWELDNGVFRLPEEFISLEALQVVTQHNTELLNSILSYERKSWYDYLSEQWKVFGKYIQLGLAIAGGICAFAGAWNLFSYFTKTSVPQITPQLVNSGAFNTRRIARNKVIPRVNTIANMDEAVEERAVRMIEKNTIFLLVSWTTNGTVTKKKMRGLGVFGRTYLIPSHYAKYILTKQQHEKEKKIENLTIKLQRFINRECVCNLEVDKDNFLFTDNDMAYGVAPPEFPMFRDLTNYTPTVEQHAQIGGKYLHIECEQDRQMITSVPGVINGMVDRQKVQSSAYWEEYDIFDAYLTSYGKTGSCGSVLITDANAPLFAFHVAGIEGNALNDTGFAIPLIREDLEELRRGETVLSYWVPTLKDASTAQMQLDGSLLPVGAVEKRHIAFMPKKTKIIPSLLQGKIEDNGELVPVVTQPGILSASDKRYNFDKSPLYYGCLKHTNPPKKFKKEILDYCVDQLASEFNSKMIPLRDIRTPLTLTEAITGFLDKDYYDCIDLSTSSGWPWNTNEKKVKSDLIKVTRDKHSRITECKVDEKLLQVLNFNSELRKRGIRPFTVFLDWLKDERRKAKKLALKDGTRIFSLSPVDFTIQLRQNYLDFSASFMKHREQLEHAVGINVDGPEWSRLANGLLNKSHNIVTGDYTDFGPRLASQVVRAAFDIMIRWYQHNGVTDPETLRTMIVMCEEISNSNHIMHDFIYQVMCGQPSGCAITTVLNSICNMLYIRYCWMEIFPTTTEKDFKKHVFLKVYGDDLIMAVSNEAIGEFNCQTISQLLAQYDIAFTDADKSGTVEKCTIEQASFLKNHFLRHPTYEYQWLAALDLTSVHECAQWIWKSPSNEDATIENAEQSLRLAYGHGPVLFNNWKRSLNDALITARLPSLSLTWKRVDGQFFKIEECLGVYTKCIRFDDGLGLNAFVNLSGKMDYLKEEVRNEQISSIVRLLADDSIDNAASLTKGLRDEKECVIEV